MKHYNRDKLNEAAIFAMKSLMTLNSGGFIAYLNFKLGSNSVFDGEPLVCFALGISFVVLMLGFYYLVFFLTKFRRKKALLQRAFRVFAIVFAFASGFSFLFGVWSVVL